MKQPHEIKSQQNVYSGIVYMLLAALGFSVMGGAAKFLKNDFNAGQLVFWRNFIGFVFLVPGLFLRPPQQTGGHFLRLIFRGMMGTTALYTLLYCILHIPLGTAMSYNLTSALFIALFSFVLFREYEGKWVLLALLIGFAGMILIYKPNMELPWLYHLAGLISGIASAIAYLTVGRLTAFYDTRIIVLSFVATGIIIPLVFIGIRLLLQLPADDLLFIEWKTPSLTALLPLLLLGLAALFGQYFVTKAYGAGKAGIVSVIGYSNILFSVFIGMLMGDAFPDWISWLGVACIIGSGMIISFVKKRNPSTAS